MLHRPLRFVTFLAPNMLPVYRCVCAHVGRRLGHPTELHVGGAYREVADADVAFICSLPYVELARRGEADLEPLAAPVLRGPRYRGRPIYFSDVVVRRDSPCRSFADLRGCAWCYNEPWSHSGYGVTRYWLVQMGETAGFFGRVFQSGYHERSLRLVAAGEADASAIDSQVLAIAFRDHPELASRLRVIGSLGPSTIQPVVASRRLPPALRADLRAALAGMAADADARQHLAHGFVERFVPVGDETYDDIRHMLRAAEAAGFTTLQ
jgi:phosphonate transport system substrate-binding protein